MRKILLAAIAAGLISAACSGLKRGRNELFNAVSSGDLAELEAVVDAHPSVVDAHLNDGWTAMAIAARDGNVDAVALLISKGADVNRLEGGGNSPIFWAAYNGHEVVVSMLLEHGALVLNKCSRCRDPLEVAKELGHEEIVRLLESQDR